ncbi:MAG: hydrogenase expression/formation protein HypE, partial [Chloroflexi bacterium]|nr:hydrogenase expression/formation protein HypE [Chloroflexota bacterium]
MKHDKVLLAHGSGGKLSQELIEKKLAGKFPNPILDRFDDSAAIDFKGRLAFTTDSYTVSPIFFPGGDIGKLAVCGTVNDITTGGAKPLYLSLALIIEEGFPFTELDRIIASIAKAAEEANVSIVTGDTKVVNQGSADKIFINTAGIGKIAEDTNISGCNAKEGDKIIISGSLGDHGIAIMAQREGLSFSTPIASDCAPLNSLVADILDVAKNVHVLRDPTRGGLATTLNEIAKQSAVGITIEENKLPIKEAVRAACELLGLDPLYVANEGKMIVILPPEEAEKVLAAMKKNRYGTDSTIIGEVIIEQARRVTMKTLMGTN